MIKYIGDISVEVKRLDNAHSEQTSLVSTEPPPLALQTETDTSQGSTSLCTLKLEVEGLSFKWGSKKLIIAMYIHVFLKLPADSLFCIDPDASLTYLSLGYFHIYTDVETYRHILDFFMCSCYVFNDRSKITWLSVSLPVLRSAPTLLTVLI